jgi:BTB/POZ domain
VRHVHMVCRSLPSNVASIAAVEVPLDEHAATVRLLISGMYAASSEVSWSNVEALLQLAREYDVEDIQLNCERFLSAEPLTKTNLPRCMELACRFGLKAAVERCQAYIATANNYVDLDR